MEKVTSFLQIKFRCFNLLCVLLTIGPYGAFSQQLSGSLKHHSNQEIRLFGYDGFETIELARSTIDASGNFILLYQDYIGMGYIETSDDSQLYLVLNETEVKITATHLKEPDSITFTNSNENLIFNQFAVEHNQRERALAGWKFLLPQYEKKKLLTQQKGIVNIIQKEIDRLEKQDLDFLNNLNSFYYVSWFLPLRKLLDDIPLSIQKYTQRIPKHLADIRNIDFNDSRLYHSGILDDLLESHYWMLENAGMTLDSMYMEMNASTDILIQNIEQNEKLLNEVSDFLFSFLEKRSLYKASEHLALKSLTQSSCLIEKGLAKRMETYRAMKVGKIAPDIVFEGKKMMMGGEINKDLRLSDLKSDYILIVFGASWCSNCELELPKIREKYLQWKLKGVETVFVSLDHDNKEFTSFVKDFPFLSFCDFKGWENKAVIDYYVFAVPTLFLLNNKREIILRPNSIEQADAWFKYKLGP